jgi:hypothetical protein
MSLSSFDWIHYLFLLDEKCSQASVELRRRARSDCRFDQCWTNGKSVLQAGKLMTGIIARSSHLVMRRWMISYVGRSPRSWDIDSAIHTLMQSCMYGLAQTICILFARKTVQSSLENPWAETRIDQISIKASIGLYQRFFGMSLIF